MKRLFLYSLAAFVAASAFAAPFNTDPTPSLGDSYTDSLKKVNKLLNDAKTGASPLVLASGTTATATPAIVIATSSGSVAAGARSVQFIGTTGYVGTILSATASGTTQPTFTAPNGATLTAIPYTVTSGSLIISTVR